MHDDVTISIVTYNALLQCRRTIEAILPTLDGARLVMSANGNKSALDYFYEVRAKYANTAVISHPDNMGFIIPNNYVFSKCWTKYFVMLNDDCIPPPDWLDKLKAALEPRHTVIAGARGTCQTLDANFIGRPGKELDYIEASCMMLKRDMMTKPLFSDDIVFGYCEDADLCLRVRQRGYEIAQADFACEHKRNTTSRTIPGIRSIMERNFETCRRKWSFYLKNRRFA